MTKTNSFWSDERLPFVELRRTSKSAESYKPHVHGELLIGAVTSGSTQLKVGTEHFELTKGELALINPGQVHSCNPREKEMRSYCMLFLDPDWCLTLQQDLFGRQGAFLPLSPSLLQDSELHTTYLNLSELLRAAAPILEKEEALTTFVGDLFERYCDRKPRQLPAAPRLLIDEIRTTLTRDLTQNLSLSDLAAAFGMNPFHLLRLFKGEVGLPPHTFLLNARIERAKELLRANQPPARVAQETGFSDQSHFHRTFRAIVSATPGEYQKRPL